MHIPQSTEVRATGLCIGIVTSRYHEEITTVLRQGAIEEFLRLGGDEDALVYSTTPGAFELIAVVHSMAQREEIDGVIALGCVIKGETDHNQFINQAVAHGLSEIVLRTGTPVGMGILTCDRYAQAEERSGGARGNKGRDAMGAAVESIARIRSLQDPADIMCPVTEEG